MHARVAHRQFDVVRAAAPCDVTAMFNRNLLGISVLPFAALIVTPSLASAVTLRVGAGMPYATPSAAAAVAADGDVIEIAPGTYRNFATWRANNLTIRGVGGRPHLDAAGLAISNGKAIWVIQGRGTTVENIEFSGAAVPDGNGAGIRQEGSGLNVRGCYFHNNENGILAGDSVDSDIVVEASEFAHNGMGDGLTHNMYINHVRSFTLRGCYSHASRAGHLVKSRALTTYILYNRLTGEDGTPSYEVNLPNGGAAFVIGNVIQQTSTSPNGTILTFAEEGASNPTQTLYVVNNTFVNDRTTGSSIFVRLAGTPTARIVNNLFVGPGTVVAGTAMMMSNLMNNAPGFADRAAFDLRLTAGSPAIDMGTDPGMAGTVALAPSAQYRHTASTEVRSVVGPAIDIGAYEFGTVTIPGDGGTTLTDSGIPVTDGGTNDGAVTVTDSGTAVDSGIASMDAGDSGSFVAGDAARGDVIGDAGSNTMRGGCGCEIPIKRRTGKPARVGHVLVALGALILGRRTSRRGRRSTRG